MSLAPEVNRTGKLTLLNAPSVMLRRLRVNDKHSEIGKFELTKTKMLTRGSEHRVCIGVDYTGTQDSIMFEDSRAASNDVFMRPVIILAHNQKNFLTS